MGSDGEGDHGEFWLEWLHGKTEGGLNMERSRDTQEAGTDEDRGSPLSM